MKKKYEEPEMIIDRFEENDGILTSSTQQCDCDFKINIACFEGGGYTGNAPCLCDDNVCFEDDECANDGPSCDTHCNMFGGGSM